MALEETSEYLLKGLPVHQLKKDESYKAEPKVYRALLTQSGTDAPAATVLENTLGGTVVWSYDNQGRYVATLAGAFTENKISFTAAPCANADDGTLLGFVGYAWIDVDSIKIRSVSIADLPSSANDVLFETAIEILVYP